MYFDFLVKIPENTGKISLNRRNGTTYVEYTYGRRYVPEKKYNVPQRTTIGKMEPSDPKLMYPNPNFLKYFPEVELPEEKDRSKRSSCLRIGSYILIRKLVADYGLDEMMKRIIGKDSGLFWISRPTPSFLKIMPVSTIRIMVTTIRFLRIKCGFTAIPRCLILLQELRRIRVSGF